MVVKYTLPGQTVRRESKYDHALTGSLREVVREVADLPSSAAASLVSWSQENPEAAESEMPTRRQVSRRKSLQRARQGESSIEEVQALVAHLQEREVDKEWQFEILAEDLAQGIICFSSGVYINIFRRHQGAIQQHGWRLACDATHDVSNSNVKLFALGWLAQYSDGVIRNTFVPLAFGLAPSESSAATYLLLRSTDGYLQQKCGFTLKDAKVAHLDGGTGLVKGFQDYFGTGLPLARSLEHVKSNIKKEGILGNVPNALSEHLEDFVGKQTRRMSVAGIQRLLESGEKIRLDIGTEGVPMISVFCKYHPEDYDEQKMPMLATLEAAEDADAVDACFRAIGALTDETDGSHFHPRMLRALYAQFTAIYTRGGATLESHKDFSQCGMMEYFATCQLERGALALPEKFSSLKPKGPSTGRPKGRPKGVSKPGPRDLKTPPQKRGLGQENQPGRKRKAATQEEELAELVDAQIADLFAVQEDAPDHASPGTPPDIAARFAILMQEGTLPRTTRQQRRRNQRTSGTTYGVPQGVLSEALEHGYIHPNLPAPPGLRWARTAPKTMALVVRGG